jgi:hypothetical protein
MKKLLVVGGLMAGAALAGRRCMARCGRIDFEERIERMPDWAPRKWLFQNIGAIRQNTEWILERLDAKEADEAQTEPPAATD